MMNQNVKISELPSSETLEGFSAVGVSAENLTVKVSMDFVASAAKGADQARDAANTAAIAASAATTATNAAKDAANTATNNANNAATAANTAASRVDTTIASANAAADNANAKATLADQKAAAAVTATTAANTATTNANAAREAANTAADNANAKATLADQKAAAAVTATTAANTATDNANAARDKALEVARNPTKVGADNYVYTYDTGAKKYVKTDIYVKGDDGGGGFEVNEVRMSYSMLGNIFGEKYLPCDGAQVSAASYPDLRLPRVFDHQCACSGAAISELKAHSDGCTVLCGTKIYFSQTNGIWAVAEPVIAGITRPIIPHSAALGGSGYAFACTDGLPSQRRNTLLIGNPDTRSFRITRPIPDEEVDIEKVYNLSNRYFLVLGGSRAEFKLISGTNLNVWDVGYSFDQDPGTINDMIESKGGSFVLASDKGLFYLLNDGQTEFKKAQGRWPSDRYIAVVKGTDGLYALHYRGIIMKSTDTGVTWTEHARFGHGVVTGMYYGAGEYYITTDTQLFASADAVDWAPTLSPLATKIVGAALLPNATMGIADQVGQSSGVIVAVKPLVLLPKVANGYIKLLK